MKVDSLYNIAEVSIALAGFSGLVAVFRSERLGSWLPRERFLFWLLLAFTLGAVFFSLLPVALLGLHLSEKAVWGVSSSLLSIYLVGMYVVALAAHVRMNRGGYRTSRPAAWYIFPPGGLLAVAVLALNAAGIGLSRDMGPYYVGLLFLLLAGSMAFVFLLIFPVSGRRP